MVRVQLESSSLQPFVTRFITRHAVCTRNVVHSVTQALRYSPSDLKSGCRHASPSTPATEHPDSRQGSFCAAHSSVNRFSIAAQRSRNGCLHSGSSNVANSFFD